MRELHIGALKLTVKHFICCRANKALQEAEAEGERPAANSNGHAKPGRSSREASHHHHHRSNGKGHKAPSGVSHMFNPALPPCNAWQHKCPFLLPCHRDTCA